MEVIVVKKERLTYTEPITPLKELYIRNDDVGDKFRKNIHAYNSIFAFTSMRVKLDKDLAS
ncbi:22693_t:CDS:2, partial [Dentiscutata erythropus]